MKYIVTKQSLVAMNSDVSRELKHPGEEWTYCGQSVGVLPLTGEPMLYVTWCNGIKPGAVQDPKRT